MPTGPTVMSRDLGRNSPLGLYTRLASHASGRRSGDQFCVYVADRLVRQTLSQADIAAISSGEHQMDAYGPRWRSGYRIEAAIKNGDRGYGRPLLNPARLQ